MRTLRKVFAAFALSTLAVEVPAHACSKTVIECPSRRFEGVPRNVRYLPAACVDGLRRVRPPPDDPADDFEPDPGQPDPRDETRTRVFASPIRTPLGRGVRPWFRLAPHVSYEWGATRFETSDRVDHDAPRGGALRDVLVTEEHLVFVFEPVEEESPAWVQFESWNADAPARRTSVRASYVTVDPDADPRRLHRGRAALEPEVWTVLAPHLPATVVQDWIGCTDCGCGSSPARGDTFRTRWVDAAGNAGPWSEPRPSPTAGRRVRR